MDKELTERLKSLSLSEEENREVELDESDIKIGYEEGGRGLIGKVFGAKKANIAGVCGAMLKLWGHAGLCKVIMLKYNTFQFIFASKEGKAKVLQGRLWTFDKSLLILKDWDEDMNWAAEHFQTSPMWI